jgi:hypothetical protein
MMKTVLAEILDCRTNKVTKFFSRSHDAVIRVLMMLAA